MKTRDRRTGRAAERVSRLRGWALFVANTNHEIRTPLQAILGMTDLLSETPLMRKQQTYLESIRGSSKVLLKIIDDILDFSALEAGQLHVKTCAVDAERVVEPALTMLGQAAYSKGVELACHVRGECGRADADPDRLSQVLVNLVGNALKFTDRGEVVVEVSQQTDSKGKDWIEFAVKDTGVGIDVTKKREMFLPFSRIGSTANRPCAGTGLGLAICKQLVELMGGSIDIDVRATGGTVARFRMPAASSPPEGDVDQLSQFVGAKVLIVDDNPTVAEAIGSSLHALGMRVEYALDGSSAIDRLLECAANAPFRIAIIDADMPRTDGIATALKIRSEAAVRDTSIILLTSLVRPLWPGAASSLQVLCVDKPVVPRLLRSAVACALSPGGRQAQEHDEWPSLQLTAGSRILVVDDHPVSRQTFEEMGSLLGFNVDVVADGISAINSVARQRYEFVLLDSQLPDLDGIEVARRIRSSCAPPDRPVIVAVTATASAEDRVRCMRAGMDAYLPKPVTLATLRETLASWLPDCSPQPRVAQTANELIADDGRSSDGADSSEISHLFELFIEDSEQRLATLSRMLGDENLDARKITREAHALKSGCLHIQAGGLAELSNQLERCARDGAVDELPALFDRLCSEFDAFRQQPEDAWVIA